LEELDLQSFLHCIDGQCCIEEVEEGRQQVGLKLTAGKHLADLTAVARKDRAVVAAVEDMQPDLQSDVTLRRRRDLPQTIESLVAE